MGCDTIGYLMVGPRVFTKKKIEKAKKRASRIRHVAIQMLLEDYEPRTKDDREIRDWIQGELNNNMCDLESFDINTDEEVYDFLSVWAGSYRDVVYRTSPDNPKEQIVFVGGASWGDSPSESYDDVQRAYSFQIPDTLGVR